MILVLSILVNINASVDLALDTNPDSDIKLDLWEQYELLLTFSDELDIRQGFSNQINYIGYAEDHIAIGLLDMEDEDLKKEILSLPGIDNESIEFRDIVINGFSFATEPPEGEK
jgi:hypothetical protein